MKQTKCQVNFNGSQNVQISTTLNGSFATDAEVATAKGEAISDAEDYTDAREAAITSAYQSYADAAEADAISAAAADATSKANAAKSGAEATAAAALASAVSDLEDYADQAEVDAKAYTDTRESAITSAYQAYADAAESDAVSTANAYTDAEIAALVDSAPALLDTLNELAAAIADNPNYATDVANLIATKADTSYVDSEISDLDTAAQGYASTAQSNAESFATTAAGNAQSAAEDYADGLAGNYDPAGSAATAQSNAESFATTAANNAQLAAEATASADATTKANNAQSNAETFATNAINALTTSDIEEGSNQYFTSTRAKIAAANLITSATKTNIVITGDENGLTITAENGVADSSTSDLAEGSNLYFTDARAVDALEAVVPNFTAVELNSVAKQVAATASVPTASTNTASSWLKADYRSAEFLVKIANGSHTDVSKVILTLDTSDNVAITEYAMVGTNGSLGSVSADVSGNDVRLRVTTANNNSNVTVVGTLLA